MQVNFSYVTDCESLIRKMLVLDPSKRYSVENIKRHRWMVAEAPRLLPSTGGEQHGAEPNEQILRLMQSLGIDAVKTREVSCHLQCIAHIVRLGPYFVPNNRDTVMGKVWSGRRCLQPHGWYILHLLLDVSHYSVLYLAGNEYEADRMF